MTYGDGLSNINLKKLLKFHKKNKKLVTLTAVRPPARFGALKLKGQYVNYFKEKITFPIKNKIDIDVEKVFTRVDKSGDVVLKCDIDGGEYKIIDGILKYSSRIKMLIFEFHLVDNNEENFYNSIKKIKDYFEIIHIHGNNHFSKLNSGLPFILEITLINKKYAPKNSEHINNFPIQGLDYPNNPYKEDLAFSFSP